MRAKQPPNPRFQRPEILNEWLRALAVAEAELLEDAAIGIPKLRELEATIHMRETRLQALLEWMWNEPQFHEVEQS